MRLPDGYTLDRRATVDSTNAVALALAAGGAPHGTVVLADSQSAGRGRRGRSWASLPGNLFLSVVARPPAGCMTAQIAFVAALGAAEALAGIDGVALKWPNDVLVEGRKVAGILVEADGGAAVVGIGVNVAAAPEGEDIGANAADLGGRVDRIALAEDVLAGFDGWYRRWTADGFAPLREAWLARAYGLGGPVTAAGRSGRFVGLDRDGGLILAGETGEECAVTAGEVFFGEPACC